VLLHAAKSLGLVRAVFERAKKRCLTSRATAAGNENFSDLSVNVTDERFYALGRFLGNYVNLHVSDR
jgi:hypothetical protein